MKTDKIDKAPSAVRVQLPDEAGQEIFVKSFNEAAEGGYNRAYSAACAWQALEKRGYKPDEKGIWHRKTAMDRIRELAGHSSSSIEKTFDIIDKNEDQHLVWGWASVISKGGKAVVDRQGDVISADTLTKAATEFMLDVRKAKAMHEGDSIGEVVHSLPLTGEIAKALGIETDVEGWIIAMKIHNDEVWQLVKSGQLSAFSIGGMAVSSDIEMEDDK